MSYLIVGANNGLPNAAVLQSQAANRLGFTQYSLAAQKRAIALSHPDDYTQARDIYLLGGSRPAAGTAAHFNVLYPGVVAGSAVVSVQGQVTALYSTTLTNAVAAGIDVYTAEELATRAAQSLYDQLQVVHDMTYPNVFATAAEETQLKNLGGNYANRAILDLGGAKKRLKN